MKTVLEYLAADSLETLRERAERSTNRARNAIADAAFSLQVTDHILYRKALESALAAVWQKRPENPSEEERIQAILGVFIIVGSTVLGSTLDCAAYEAAHEADQARTIPRNPVDPDRLTPGVN